VSSLLLANLNSSHEWRGTICAINGAYQRSSSQPRTLKVNSWRASYH